MRDYFVYPAQTNLERYAQAIEHNYSPGQRRSLSVPHISLRCLRSIRWLGDRANRSSPTWVGSASLVLESGCPDDWVTGALLHALYQRRVPFAGGLLPDDRRGVLAARFGATVDDLVFRYTAFESADLSQCRPQDADTQTDVVALRLADELEDLSGYALALHGNPASDDLGLRGGYPWRRESKAAEAGVLVALAERLGLDGIGRGLRHWLDFTSTPPELADMRTGWLSSVNLTCDLKSED